VITISLVAIPYRIAALQNEQSSLLAYPVDRLANVIKAVGFRCTRCARCCTRLFNGHVFLIDREVAGIRAIDPAAVEPAPGPEFCDQNGTFYVSGYALRAQDDEEASCWFLEHGRCRIYGDRLTICRIYPYMLHREPDERGVVDWRQIAGLDMHGEYHTDIPDDECIDLARRTKEYENAILTQEIAFLRFMEEHFARHQLRHVQKVYDDRMRAFAKGYPITVMVYCNGSLEPCTLRP
jgi:hypothetical protein